MTRIPRKQLCPHQTFCKADWLVITFVFVQSQNNAGPGSSYFSPPTHHPPRVWPYSSWLLGKSLWNVREPYLPPIQRLKVSRANIWGGYTEASWLCCDLSIFKMCLYYSLLCFVHETATTWAQCIWGTWTCIPGPWSLCACTRVCVRKLTQAKILFPWQMKEGLKCLC